MDFQDYLVPGKTGLLIGIGGVSMSPLAEVLHGAGLDIRGSDMCESDNTLMLRERGIPIHIGHSAANVTDDIAFVIRTAAVHDDNPEVHEAHRRGIPVFERTQAWGALMRGYPNALCISGTHGKTTTTSMCTHIMMAAEKDPTVMIGGTLPLLHSGYRVGHGDTIILESCEYCNSFLSFFPTVAVILNVEPDHLDFFKDLNDIEHSFHKFAQLVPPAGHVIVNADNQGAMDSVQGLEHPIITFGLERPADCTASNLHEEDGLPVFDVLIHGQFYAHVTLHVGLGTFRPVKVDDVEQHHMHSEFYKIEQSEADKINKAKKEGHRVIAVGTTSTRTLESAADENGFLTEKSGWTEIFIYPGYQFKVIDSLITNFHLPESTLVMLVSALAGREHVLAAYEEAVKEKYRFFSFGDAMLIE